MMLLLIVLCMDEVLEKGLNIISSKFQGVEGQSNQEEMKQLFIGILEKKERMKAYKELYANVFFTLLQTCQEKPIYLKVRSYK